MGIVEGGQAFNAWEEVLGERAGQIYRRKTSLAVPLNGVVHLGIGKIINANKNNDHRFIPGLLGETMKTHGPNAVAIFGNGDLPGQKDRHVSLMAMDATGFIPQGVVDDTILEPYGGALWWRTDYNKIIKDLIPRLPVETRLIIVDVGDLTRLDKMANELLPELERKTRMEAFARIDHFIGELLQTFDPAETYFMILSSTPPGHSLWQKDYLGPVLFAGPGIEAGVLTSGTTRRPGIISNLDIAPTILSYLGTDVPITMAGQVIKAVPPPTGESGVIYLQQVQKRLRFIHFSRPTLLRVYILAQIIVVALAAIFILIPYPATRLFRLILLILASGPLSMLLAGALQVGNLISYGIALLGLSIALALAVWRIAGYKAFGVVSGVTCLAILFDGFTGSGLMQYSILGYDPIAGARYYGVGNEYMGVLLGSTIMGSSALLQSYASWPGAWYIVIATMGMVVILLALPILGSNFGGTIAAVIGFGCTLAFLRYGSLRLRHLFLLLTILVIIIGGIIVFDMQRSPEARSHLGRITASVVTDRSIVSLGAIVTRKMAMNYKLIKYTIWSRVFLAMLAVMAIMMVRPVGVVHNLRNKYHYLFRGVYGLLSASFIALVANDSGIVAAATMMIYGAVPVIDLVLQEKENG